MDTYWIVCIAVLVLVTIGVLILKKTSGFSDIIPKTIWTYWDSPIIPETVQKCIETWKKHNPDYTIIVLSDDKLSKYLPDVDILAMKMAKTPQRKSDFIRIHIIEKYGGAWCDATIMMKDSLEFVRQKTGYDFVGYHIEGMMSIPESPVVENWFMMAPPGSNFIRKWKETFLKINDFNRPNDYVNSIKNQGVDISKIKGPNYLTMHVAAQHVIQKQMSRDEVSKKMYLMKAEDGPFKYLSDNNWDSRKGVRSICNTEYDHPIVKFRGSERGLIEKYDELKCVFDQ